MTYDVELKETADDDLLEMVEDQVDDSLTSYIQIDCANTGYSDSRIDLNTFDGYRTGDINIGVNTIKIIHITNGKYDKAEFLSGDTRFNG